MKKILLLGSMLFAFASLFHAQLVTEGFETGFVNFQNAAGSTTPFVIDSTIFHAGTKSTYNQYANTATDTLYQSAVVDLTTTVTPQLIFWHICKLEGSYDFGYVYISTDSGATYSVLPTTSYLGTSSGADGYGTAGRFNEDSYATLWGTSTATVLNTWWKKEAFDLSAYTAFTNVKVMFVLTSDGSVQREGWYIDDISIENVSCPKVAGIGDFGTGSDTNNITWLPSVSDTLWNVQYGAAGFALGTGTSTGFSTTDTIGIGSLSPITTYDVYVRSICKAGDSSSWQGPFTFTTSCSFFTPTYTQDFSTMTFATTPQCWDQATGIMTVNSTLSTLGTSNWGSDNFANVTGASNCAYLNLYATNRNDWLISPSIDLGTGSLPYQVEFDIAFTDFANATASAAGLGPDDKIALLISTDNGTTWSDTNILMIWDSSNTAPSFTGQYVAYNLTTAGYTGLVRLAFYAESTLSNEDNDVHIDNFTVRIVPTCPRPQNLRTTSIYSDSVNLTWDTASTDGPYRLQYGAPGFVVGSGTTVGSLNDSTFINGLTSNTTYDVYLRTICTAGDTSLWTGPLQFTTPCSPFIPAYTEDFTTMTFSTMPSCWQQAKGIMTVNSAVSVAASNWESDVFGNVTGASNSAYLNLYTTNRNDWLISPTVDLGTGSVPYQVEFDIAFTDFANNSAPAAGLGSDDKIALLISTDNGATWSDTNILVKWDTSVPPPSVTGQYVYVNLTAAGYTGLVRFAFYAESTVTNEDNDLFIDNFGVVQVPTCPRPINLTFDSATQTTANLSWTNGGADVSWFIEYGAPGFTLGTGTTYASGSNPAVVPGLTASTCYDAYLRSFCAAGDTSQWIGPIRFCTDCAPVVDACEDFEGYASGELPICWKKFIATTGSSTVGINTFGGNFAPNAVQMNSGSPAATVLMLISPEMTALALGTHRANFWVEGSFTTDTTLVIGTMSDPADPSTFNPIQTINTITSSYQNFKISFAGYTGTDKHVAFLYNPTATSRSLTIDDFCFEPIPSCEKASFVTVLNPGQDSTSLRIGWNYDTTSSASLQTSFIVAYGPAGYDPVTNPAGGDTVTSLFNAGTINGLNPLTEYCVWVKAVCANGDTSFWDGPYCAETGCPSSTGLPYFEDFDSYTNVYPDGLPLCWEEGQGVYTSGTVPAIQSSQWIPDGFGNVGTTGSARMEIWSTGRNEWFISPSIDLGSSTGRHIRIEYDVAATIWNTTAPAVFGDDDSLVFMISRNNGVSWDNSGILAVYDTSNVPSSTGDAILIDLPNETGIVKFAFYATSKVSNQDNNVYIDNFHVYDSSFVGLKELSVSDNFKVYPNPNQGLFTILNEGNSVKSSVKVVDVQGRLVFDEVFFFNKNGQKQIDISSLNAGVYVLMIQSEGKLEQHRIIVSK